VPARQGLCLGASPIGEGDVGAFDPVERRIAERGDEDLVAGGVEPGPADGADARLSRAAYLE
jgi:hypothetical protein